MKAVSGSSSSSSSGKRNGKAQRHEGDSRDSSPDDEKSNDDLEALAALEAHFAQSFELPAHAPSKISKRKNGKKMEKAKAMDEDVLDDSSAPEPNDTAKSAVVSRKKTTKATPLSKAEPEMIVFGESSSSRLPTSGETIASSGWKKFMSSKVTTKTDEEKKLELEQKKKAPQKSKRGAAADAEPKGEGEEDELDEKQAITNDRELSKLLSTTLFAPGGAGVSTIRSNGRPNLGSNDTLARLLESSSMGKGSSQGRGYGAALLKSKEMSKMPATIRHGMRRVEMENQEKELQRQKELGNYHHSIKGLIGKRDGLDLILGTKEKDRKKRTREKGLAMGVGKFTGGTLKLSDREVQRINSNNSGSSQKRRRT